MVAKTRWLTSYLRDSTNAVVDKIIGKEKTEDPAIYTESTRTGGVRNGAISATPAGKRAFSPQLLPAPAN